MSATGSDCPKYGLCANADLRCFLCKNFSLFKEGKSRGKGDHAEKKVRNLRNKKAYLRRGSGAAAHAKGDVIDPSVLHESKAGYGRVDAKGNASFTLKRAWLIKIAHEALMEGRMPVLDIHFNGTPDDEIYSVVPAAMLFDLLAEREEKQ
jgi:hypothetical protein